MAPRYDDTELSKALDKIDVHLAQSEGATKESTADLVKSLADVAKGAIGLAEDKQTKRKAKAARLAKAAKAAKEADDDDKDDDDDGDDDDGDGDDEDMPKWLKDVVHDGKSEGDTILAPGRETTGTSQMTNAGGESRSLSKSISDMDVVDVEGYLEQQLAEQAALTKALKRVTRLTKALVDGLVEHGHHLTRLQEHADTQARFVTTCAKALGAILTQRETYLDTPLPSRFTNMEKSIQAAQHRIDQEGGSVFDPTKQTNKELLQKAVMTGKISQEQMTLIKRTQRLPAGVLLN